MATSLHEFAPFDVSNMSNAGTRWNKWIKRFELLLSALNMKETTTNEKAWKRALLLHYIGTDAFDIYETLEDDDEPSYASTKKVLTDYFTPKVNKECERFVFSNIKQSGDENIEQFCTRLRQLSVNCESVRIGKLWGKITNYPRVYVNSAETQSDARWLDTRNVARKRQSSWVSGTTQHCYE